MPEIGRPPVNNMFLLLREVVPAGGVESSTTVEYSGQDLYQGGN